MDKVQFQLESTLPELKDLHEKGLFSRTEINQITKRRTAFETALVRQVSRKEDFFKYAEYEINLERLRKVRYKKLKYHLNPPPPSASSYSLPRRALYILKRATTKFPADLAVWLAYVEFASREGMRKVVGKGLTNALQYHPTSSTLYLLQTYYHLHPGSPFPRSAIPSTSKLDLPSAATESERESGFAIEGITPARTTLLLGLRLLPQSRDLWREYIKLELGWVEALRRRWKVLGIKDGSEKSVPVGAEGFDGDAEALAGGEGAFGPEGEDARKEILAGQLVVHAINSALEAIPPTTPPTSEDGDGMAFRQGLVVIFRQYPSPLRTKCLGVLYDQLESIAAADEDRQAAIARLIVMTKGMYDRPYEADQSDQGEGGLALSGLGLVDEIGRIGKEIRKSVKGGKASSAWLDVAGAWVLDRIEELDGDEELRQYLLSILSSLTKPSLKPPPSILIRHLALLSESSDLLATSRSYAYIYPNHIEIQNTHLQAEVDTFFATIAAHDEDLLRKTCEEVVALVTKSKIPQEAWSDVESLWRIWFDWEVKIAGGNHTSLEKQLKHIRKLSLRLGGSLPNLHGAVLGWYFVVLVVLVGKSPKAVLTEIRSSYRPSFSTFNLIFITASSSLREGKEVISLPDLEGLYEAWRSVSRTKDEKVRAALAYAEILVNAKKGKKAHDVVENVKREVRGDGSELLLDEKWKEIIDSAKNDEESEDDEDEEMGSDDESRGSEEESEGSDIDSEGSDEGDEIVVDA